MKTSLRRSLAVAAILVALSPAAGRSAPALLAVEVQSYDGPASAFTVLRNGQPVALMPFMPLQVGDKIVVPGAGEQPVSLVIRFTYGDGSTSDASVDAHSSPYCVGAPEGKCSVPASLWSNPTSGSSVSVAAWRNVSASVGSLLAEANADYFSARHESLVARGTSAPPSVPMLGGSPRPATPIVDGALAFPWFGGVAPFRARLYAGTSPRPIVERSGLRANVVRFDSLNLTRGTYRFEIVDAQNREASATFDVIAKGEIPPLAPELAAALDDPSLKQMLSPEAIATCRAAALAKAGPQWYLAAYEALLQVPDAFSEARQLRYRLSEGA